MEPRFAIFVAHATLKAHQQVQLAMEGNAEPVSRVMLQEAAQFGLRHALARLYPGLIRSPFRRDPLPEILLALRYQFEEDPESLGLSLEESERLVERRTMKARTPRPAHFSSPPLPANVTPVPGGSSSKLRKLHLRPSIHGDETPAPPSHEEVEAPLPMSDSRMRPVAGGGVVFPWEKKNR